MKSYAIGVVVAGVAAWYGMAEAQAQANIGITVTGPTAIYTDTSTIQFDGTVSGYNDYYFRLWVYLNGVQKKDSGTLCYSGSNATYFVYDTNTWGMQTGDQVTFKVRVWVNLSTYDLKYHYVTVEQGGYYGLQSGDAPERKPAGGSGTLHAAVIRSDEQELLA